MPAKLVDKFSLWLPVLLSMGVIFYLSSVPGRNIPFLFPFEDIVFHSSVFAILGFTFSRAINNIYTRISFANALLFTVIFGVIYGISDEFHQSFIPGRQVSSWDVFIDGTGSFIGSSFYI